jgi:PAS domain S-box-containing protein
VIYDRDARFVDLNDAAAAGFGAARADVIGRPLRDFIPDTHGLTVERIDRTLSEGALLQFYDRIHLPNGKDRWFQSVFQPVVIEGEEPLCQVISYDITDQKAAEERLVARGRKYELVVENMSDFVALFDRFGTIILSPENGERFHGWRSDEIVGSDGARLVHPDDRTGALKLLQRVVETGEDGQIECRLAHKNGGYMWIEAVARRVYNDQGEPEVVVAQRNISKQRRVQAALRDSEERLSLAIDGAGIGTWDWHVPTDAIAINRNWATMLGYDPDEIALTADSWRTLLHPDDAAETYALLDSHLRGETDIYEVRNRMRCKDGSWRWILDRGRVLERGEDGSPIRVAGIHLDLTDAVEAQRAIAERELQLRSLINATPDIICFKDGAGRWKQANEADLRLFRLEGVDYRGKTDVELAEYTAPELREAFLTCDASDEATWQSGEVSQGEEHILAPDGTTKTYDVIKVPLFEPDGSRHGLIVFGRDVTDRERARRALEHAVDERDRLMQELNHRVKNNIAMVGALISIKDAELGDIADLSDIKNRLEVIRTIHEKLTHDLGGVDVVLGEYVTELLGGLFNSFAGRAVDLDYEIPQLRVSAKDAVTIGLIVNELATNAAKYAFPSENAPRFSVHLRTTGGTRPPDQPSPSYQLEIANNGATFPPDIDPMQPQTMGLRLVHSLVAQIDGVLSFSATPETTFVITLPGEVFRTEGS